jgi:D-sedoheptulose 7-phosphate isomerase
MRAEELTLQETGRRGVQGHADGADSHAARFLADTCRIAALLDAWRLEAMAASLAELRAEGGRLFFLGVGGGAANASHAVCDFRKLAGLECYSAADNTAELTARTNDDGWTSTFVEFLRGSRLGAADGVFVFSVGGGDEERNVSPNLVGALHHARSVGARVYGVVGRDGGSTARLADHCIVVPTVDAAAVTPHTESFQMVVSHLLVTHPLLLRGRMKWESVSP